MTVDLKCLAPRPMASMRLLCFPFAGAGASTFRGWAEMLPVHIEPWAAHLPAREDRLRATAYEDWAPMQNDLMDAYNQLPVQPTALFGHSMGAIMAFELARCIQARGRGALQHLFVSGRAWPGNSTSDDQDINMLDDAGLLEGMESRYGSLPPSMAHPDIRKMVTTTLRSDLRLLGSYQYRPGPALNCPLTVLTGEADPTTCDGQAAAWGVESCSIFTALAFPGGHFFLEPEKNDVIAAISARLAPS